MSCALTCCSTVMYSRSYRQCSLNWECVPSLLPITAKEWESQKSEFPEIQHSGKCDSSGNMFIRGQSSFCIPVDRSLQNGPSNSLAETYHTMTKTKNVGKGQWINEQVFHTVGFSTGKPEAILCLAMASSI